MEDDDANSLLDKITPAIKSALPKRTGYILLLVTDRSELGFASNMQSESVVQALMQALEREQSSGSN